MRRTGEEGVRVDRHLHGDGAKRSGPIPIIVAFACGLALACDRDAQPPPEGTPAVQEQPLPDEAATPQGAQNAPDQAKKRSTRGAPAGAGLEQPLAKKQLKQFADAYVAVQALNAEYAPKVSSASDAAKAQAIQQKASKAMAAAVNEAGLTPNEYSTIARRVERDPQLARRLAPLMQGD
jgi:hypothetical protein